MIYKQKIRIPESEKVKIIKVASCIKCNSDDIKIEEYEDTFGFISTATCNKCKREIKENCSEVYIVKEWNRQNDISIVIKNKKSLIAQTQKEIKELEKKQNKRK